MRDFDLQRACRLWSGVYEQERASTIYGGAEIGDFAGSGATERDDQCGVPVARLAFIVVLAKLWSYDLQKKALSFPHSRHDIFCC